ncbi:PMEI domain-containing protein [Forsythia ovata]|uniref:PMEI domain-containing protein n=1 Tax=Forsythia ovata TaxID=205694 RepID=A0ABD1WYE2_9LAMI
MDIRKTQHPSLPVLILSPKAAKAKDTTALSQVAVDSVIDFSNKTNVFFKVISKDKKMKPILKPIIKECISTIAQFKLVANDVKEEVILASFDIQMAGDEIDASRNKIILKHVKLCTNIADSVK